MGSRPPPVNRRRSLLLCCALSEKQEVLTVRQELRPQMAPLLTGVIERRHWGRLTPGGGNPQKLSTELSQHNHVILAPRPADSDWDSIHRLWCPARQIDRLEFSDCKGPDGATVGGPKRGLRALSARKSPRFQRIERPDPQLPPNGKRKLTTIR